MSRTWNLLRALRWLVVPDSAALLLLWLSKALRILMRARLLEEYWEALLADDYSVLLLSLTQLRIWIYWWFLLRGRL